MTMRFVSGMFAGGAIAGVLATGLTAWLTWPSVTLERSYCTVCGMHREVLKTERLLREHRRTHERAGVVSSIFRDAAGAHVHHWSRPSRTDDPRATETLADEIARGEIADLDALEAHPGMIALLEQATHEDRAKSLAFIQRVLDPAAYVGAGAVALLDHPSWPWEARWRLIDGFNAQYRCRSDELSVSCTAPVGPIAAVMFQETAGVGVAVSASDWRGWTPQGFTAPTEAIPTAPQGPSEAHPSPTPAPTTNPPAPTGTPPSAAPTAAPDASVPRPAGASAAVARGRTALNNGDLSGALASYREARAASGSDGAVRSLGNDIRQRGSDMATERILRGDCEDAQSIDRNLRASGIEPDESMFGPACPPP